MAAVIYICFLLIRQRLNATKGSASSAPACFKGGSKQREIAGTTLNSWYTSICKPPLQFSQKILWNYCCHFISEETEVWQDEEAFPTACN